MMACRALIALLLLGHAVGVRGQEGQLGTQRVAAHAGLLVEQRDVELLNLERGGVERSYHPLAVVVQAEQREPACHHRGHREEQQASTATPMIRLSGQRSAAPRAAAVRSATAPARPAPLAPLAAAGSEPAGLCRGGLAGLSWGATFTSVMVIRGRETEGQDGQVVVQISSVELADTIDHLVEQLLPGPVQGAEGLPDQVHQAFAAEPL